MDNADPEPDIAAQDENTDEQQQAQQGPAARPWAIIWGRLWRYKALNNEIPNWNPSITLPGVLLLISVLPLLFGIGAELLLDASNNETGPYQVGSSVRRDLLGMFTPLALSMIIGNIYIGIDTVTKELEPFCWLAKYATEGGTGACAGDTLQLTYFGQLYFSPFKALFKGHYRVLLTSLAAIIANNVLPLLVVGMFGMNFEEEPPSPISTHAASAAAFLLVLLTWVLAIMVAQRKSGLLSSPSGLENSLDMTTGLSENNSLAPCFDGLGTKSTWTDDFAHRLNAYSFKVARRLENKEGHTPPVDIVVAGPSSTENVGHSERFFSTVWHYTGGWFLHFCHSCHPMYFQTGTLILTVVVLLALFAISNLQPWLRDTTSFNVWIGSERFARSAIASIVNTGIFLPILRYEELMNPYYLLERDQGAPWHTITAQATYPLQDVYLAGKSLYQLKGRGLSDWAHMAIVLGYYGSEIFVITWNTIAFNGPEDSGSSFWIFFSFHLLAQALMLLAVLALLLYRRKPILPLMPDNLAVKLVLLYATDIPCSDDFKAYREYKGAKKDIQQASVTHTEPELADNDQSRPLLGGTGGSSATTLPQTLPGGTRLQARSNSTGSLDESQTGAPTMNLENEQRAVSEKLDATLPISSRAAATLAVPYAEEQTNILPPRSSSNLTAVDTDACPPEPSAGVVAKIADNMAGTNDKKDTPKDESPQSGGEQEAESSLGRVSAATQSPPAPAVTNGWPTSFESTQRPAAAPQQEDVNSNSGGRERRPRLVERDETNTIARTSLTEEIARDQSQTRIVREMPTKSDTRGMVCKFGKFNGRDGKEHVGIGLVGGTMETYEWTRLDRHGRYDPWKKEGVRLRQKAPPQDREAQPAVQETIVTKEAASAPGRVEE